MIENKPNLFIVGQPKSGTSALFSFLKKHHDISVCDTKEPQYFCKDLKSQYFHLSRKDRTDTEYLKLFPNKTRRYLLEGSTAYLYSSTAAEEIYKFNPDAKIIMMFREPVDFLYTYHKQLLRNSCLFETVDDFETALNLEEDRKLGKQLPKGVFDKQFLFYSDRVKFCRQVEMFRKYFPDSQIKMLIYDDFKSDNEAVFNDVLDFLELEKLGQQNFGEVNKQVEVRNRALKQFLDKHFFPVKAFLKSAIGKKTYRRLRDAYRKIIFSSKPIERLSREKIDSLKYRYLEDVQEFSEYIGRDLVSEWGYSHCLNQGRSLEKKSVMS
jgi:hypothetical protein